MPEEPSSRAPEPNPVDRIRRRIYSDNEIPPVPGAFEMKLQLSGSILSASDSVDEAMDWLKDQNSHDRGDSSYIDIQRKKIKNILCSDEEDSDSEESTERVLEETLNEESSTDDVSEEEEMKNLLQEENDTDESDDEFDENEDIFEQSSVVKTDSSIPRLDTKNIKVEHTDSKLNILHSTLGGWDSTESPTSPNHVKQEAEVIKESEEHRELDESKITSDIEDNDYNPGDPSDQEEADVDLDPNDLDVSQDEDDSNTETENSLENVIFRVKKG